MTHTLPKSALAAYRQHTFRLAPGQHLKSVEDAIAYVNQRGFVLFWPIKGINYPSLWTAVAGDRPVADAHDDPGHVTWGWKDSQLGLRVWYYAKVLRKKSTMIAMSLAGSFYALSENYGDPAEDYLTLYQQGVMTQEAKAVYEALLDNGPLDTLALRKAARLTSAESSSRFNKAIADLQVDFKILPIAVAPVGAWRYAFVYEIAARRYPDLIEQAQAVGEDRARQNILTAYFASVGAASERDVQFLFGWRPAAARRALALLQAEGRLLPDIHLEGDRGAVWVHAGLQAQIT